MYTFFASASESAITSAKVSACTNASKIANPSGEIKSTGASANNMTCNMKHGTQHDSDIAWDMIYNMTHKMTLQAYHAKLPKP